MLFEISWVVFIATSLVLIATPGQDMMLVMSRAVAQGPRAGLATAFGVSFGLVGHTVFATLGIGAIVRASELLFNALKFVGAAYLIYIGICLLFTKAGVLAGNLGKPMPFGRLFRDGAVSDLSNPKVAIFFFSFLPQFVKPGAAHPTFSIFLLGLTYAALAFIVKGAVALFAGCFSSWLRRKVTATKWIYRCSGVVLIALGLKLARERRSLA